MLTFLARCLKSSLFVIRPVAQVFLRYGCKCWTIIPAISARNFSRAFLEWFVFNLCVDFDDDNDDDDDDACNVDDEFDETDADAVDADVDDAIDVCFALAESDSFRFFDDELSFWPLP